MLAVLSELTGCVAISIDYKLCPEYPLPRCVLDALSVYKWLCDVDGVRTQQRQRVSDHCPQWLLEMDGGQVHKKCVFAGESAGGGLCLLLLQAINADKSLSLPCCTWRLSPWTNITFNNIDKRPNAKIDAMLHDKLMDLLPNILVGNYDIEKGKMVRNEGDDGYCDPSDAKYSPFYGEVKGLCPIYMSVGASEMLLDDTLMFAEKAYKAGVDVEVEIEPYLCHVYPVFITVFPEAKQAVIRASEFMKRKLAPNQ